MSDKMDWILFEIVIRGQRGKRGRSTLCDHSTVTLRQNACRSLSRNVDRFALIHRWVPYRYNTSAVRDRDRSTRICSRRKFVNMKVSNFFSQKQFASLAKDNLVVYLTPIRGIVINTINPDAYRKVNHYWICLYRFLKIITTRRIDLNR